MIHEESMRTFGARAPSGWLIPRRYVRSKGMRGGMTMDFQLVCGAGPYELDVLVRGFESPRLVDIAGQITRAERLNEPVCALPLSLVEAESHRIDAATSTDDFGEFGFASRPDRMYGIQLGDAADAPCVLVWEGD